MIGRSPGTIAITSMLRSGNSPGQLAQRRVDDRAFLGADHADQADQPVGERDHVERAGHLQPPGDRLGHLDLRRDDHVDRHVLAAVEVGPERLEIGLVADPGDLGRHAEQEMGDLARHHVHLVRLGHRDHHVGRGAAGLLENRRQRGVTDDRLHVELVRQLLDQFRRLVDHRDVVVLGRQVAGDIGGRPGRRRR